MAEVEINGTRYMVGRLNAFEQLAVARRVTKVAAGMAQTWAVVESLIERMRQDPSPAVLAPPAGSNGGTEPPAGNGGTEPEMPPLDALAEAAKPLAAAIGEMSDEDTNFIVRLCLAKCTRHNGERWVPVMASNGVIVFDEIDLAVMLQLVWATIEEHLVSFTRGLRRPDTAGGRESMSASSP